MFSANSPLLSSAKGYVHLVRGDCPSPIHTQCRFDSPGYPASTGQSKNLSPIVTKRFYKKNPAKCKKYKSSRIFIFFLVFFSFTLYVPK